MTPHQRRLKWETIFVLDYFEKQRRLSPEDARIVCCLAVHGLTEGEQDWDLGASMTMSANALRACDERVAHNRYRCTVPGFLHASNGGGLAGLSGKQSKSKSIQN
jgi:hypothetical protein